MPGGHNEQTICFYTNILLAPNITKSLGKDPHSQAAAGSTISRGAFDKIQGSRRSVRDRAATVGLHKPQPLDHRGDCLGGTWPRTVGLKTLLLKPKLAGGRGQDATRRRMHSKTQQDGLLTEV
jgi:hypothetical protein